MAGLWFCDICDKQSLEPDCPECHNICYVLIESVRIWDEGIVKVKVIDDK